MAKKQKLLKNLLTSVSVASIVASIGGSSGAFAAANRNVGDVDIVLPAAPGFNDGDNVIFDVVAAAGGGRVTLTVDGTSGVSNIGNITATSPGNIRIDRNITIGGTVIRGATLGDTMTATINAGHTLTLSANNHTGLGAVTLNGADAELTLTGIATVHNAIDGVGAGQGILNLGIGSTVNGAIGGGNALATVNIGAGVVNVNHNVSANNVILVNNSVLRLAHGKIITAAGDGITTAADGQGTLTFIKVGTVVGNIGIDVKALAEIKIGIAGVAADAGPAVVTLQGDVYTKKLSFDVAEREVQITGNFGGGAKVGVAPAVAGAAAEVDFGAVGGTLTFNGAAAGPYTFNSRITNGNNGILNVKANLTATHADIGNIHTINIGTGAAAKSLTIDASAGNVDLLNAATAGAGAAINFLHANSELRLLTNGADSTITFYGDLAGGLVGGAAAAPGGIVSLQGEGGKTLTVQSIDGTKYLGTDVINTLQGLIVYGQVTISGGNKTLNLSKIPVLHVVNGATFTDESGTSAQIGNVHIGAAVGGGAAIPAGAATYVLDAKHANIGILTANAGGGHNNIIFEHANAQLTLRNSSTTDDKTITLHAHLAGGLAGAAPGGIVLL